MTPNELREVLADAFIGAAAGLRSQRTDISEAERIAPDRSSTEPVASYAPAGRLAMSVEEAAECLGVGRSAMYEAVKLGRVPVVRLGRRVLIPVHGLRQWLSAEAEAPSV